MHVQDTEIIIPCYDIFILQMDFVHKIKWVSKTLFLDFGCLNSKMGQSKKLDLVLGAREMAPWFRMLCARAGDLGSVPSTYTVVNSTLTLVLGYQKPPSDLLRHQATADTHTYMQVKHLYIYK